MVSTTIDGRQYLDAPDPIEAVLEELRGSVATLAECLSAHDDDHAQSWAAHVGHLGAILGAFGYGEGAS